MTELLAETTEKPQNKGISDTLALLKLVVINRLNQSFFTIIHTGNN